jgi:hypothetical protein
MWEELDNLMGNVTVKIMQKKSFNFIPKEKVVYRYDERLPIFFYSFKHNKWFIRTKIKSVDDSLGGVFFVCDLIETSSNIVLEQFASKSREGLKHRVIDYANNPNCF